MNSVADYRVPGSKVTDLHQEDVYPFRHKKKKKRKKFQEMGLSIIKVPDCVSKGFFGGASEVGNIWR